MDIFASYTTSKFVLFVLMHITFLIMYLLSRIPNLSTQCIESMKKISHLIPLRWQGDLSLYTILRQASYKIDDVLPRKVVNVRVRHEYLVNHEYEPRTH